MSSGTYTVMFAQASVVILSSLFAPSLPLPPPPPPPLPSSSLPFPSLSPQERLPSLLHSIVVSTSHPKQPSAYVHFSYSRPSQKVDAWQMLTFPHLTSWSAKPRCLSLWFSVDKYPLQAWVHLLTAFTGDVYLQVWACAPSGDVIIR